MVFQLKFVVDHVSRLEGRGDVVVLCVVFHSETLGVCYYPAPSAIIMWFSRPILPKLQDSHHPQTEPAKPKMLLLESCCSCGVEADVTGRPELRGCVVPIMFSYGEIQWAVVRNG